MTEAWVDFVAGWASGAMSVWTCQPVDTVLTRLQAGALRRDVLLKNTKGLVESAGVTSLWRGSSVMISAVPMQNAMLMGGYGIGKEWSEKHNSQKIWPVFIGGCTGGVLQSFLMAPVELVKVHQQLTSACVKTGIQFWGNAAKWRGLHATLWRDGIPHGVWFASYEWCKTTLADSLQAEKESPTEQVTIPLTSGAFAATVAWVSTKHPLLILVVSKRQNMLYNSIRICFCWI